jgi:TonB family protein
MNTQRVASLRAFPLLIGLIVASVAIGQSSDIDLRTSFSQAYERYEAAISSGDFELAAAAAEEALALGRQVFGERHVNTSTLLQNHAFMLELQGFPEEAESDYRRALGILEELQMADSPAAVPILLRLSALSAGGEAQAEHVRRALSIQRASLPGDPAAYADLAAEVASVLTRDAAGRWLTRDILQPVLEELETTLGDDSLALVPVLMALGKADAAHGDETAEIDRYSRALEIAQAALPANAIAMADLALEAGTDLLYLSNSSESRAYLEDALSIFEDELGPGDDRTAIAAMSLGEYQLTNNRLSRAEPLLLAALEVLAGRPEHEAREFRIRTMLSEMYVRDDKPDEAMPHLIALERLSALSDSQEYLPIVKVAPVYPPRALQQHTEGYVVVEYTVAVDGTVKDVKVVESSSPLFDRAAEESARRFRYIPRVIDGEPVEVEGVTTRIDFDLDD